MTGARDVVTFETKFLLAVVLVDADVVAETLGAGVVEGGEGAIRRVVEDEKVSR